MDIFYCVKELYRIFLTQNAVVKCYEHLIGDKAVYYITFLNRPYYFVIDKGKGTMIKNFSMSGVMYGH